MKSLENKLANLREEPPTPEDCPVLYFFKLLFKGGSNAKIGLARVWTHSLIQ
jgi:hypothetical protein